MLINTADGWQSITGRETPAVVQATTYRELSAKISDELAELIPSMGQAAASRAASMLLGGLPR